MTSYIFFFFFIPVLAVILLAVNFIFAPHNPYLEKNGVFECGFTSFLGQNRTQFSISFFLFALLFLLFDLEILLVYPYLVSSYTNQSYGFVILLIFLLVLTLGFVFELGKKALTIDSRQNVKDTTTNLHINASGVFIYTLISKAMSLIFNRLITWLINFVRNKIVSHLSESIASYINNVTDKYCSTSLQKSLLLIVLIVYTYKYIPEHDGIYKQVVISYIDILCCILISLIALGLESNKYYICKCILGNTTHAEFILSKYPYMCDVILGFNIIISMRLGGDFIYGCDSWKNGSIALVTVYYTFMFMFRNEYLYNNYPNLYHWMVIISPIIVGIIFFIVMLDLDIFFIKGRSQNSGSRNNSGGRSGGPNGPGPNNPGPNDPVGDVNRQDQSEDEDQDVYDCWYNKPFNFTGKKNYNTYNHNVISETTDEGPEDRCVNISQETRDRDNQRRRDKDNQRRRKIYANRSQETRDKAYQRSKKYYANMDPEAKAKLIKATSKRNVELYKIRQQNETEPERKLRLARKNANQKAKRLMYKKNKLSSSAN